MTFDDSAIRLLVVLFVPLVVENAALAAEDQYTAVDLGAFSPHGGSSRHLMSWGCAINDLGQVVGETGNGPSVSPSDNHAFLYTDGSLIDLGTLGGTPSAAEGINNLGQVVRYSFNEGGGFQAFLLGPHPMTALEELVPASGWWFRTATDINDAGKTVAPKAGAAGSAPRGAGRAVRWARAAAR